MSPQTWIIVLTLSLNCVWVIGWIITDLHD